MGRVGASLGARIEQQGPAGHSQSDSSSYLAGAVCKAACEFADNIFIAVTSVSGEEES